MVKEKKCPFCGRELIEEDGWLDQVMKPLPALLFKCSNPRMDLCGYKRWERKPEVIP